MSEQKIESVEHIHRSIPAPVQESVEITRGQKGGYGWTIKAATVDRVAEIDADLRSRFGGGEVA